MAGPRTILFLIRDKLGDSLIAANVALAFARAYPDATVSVLIRDAYAPVLAEETGIRVIPYRSGLQGWLLAWWWRVSGRRFDVLGVLRGFGERTLKLVRAIPARRVVVHDARLASVATEVAALPAAADPAEDPHQGPALRVAQAIAPDFAAPGALHFPALAGRWHRTAKRYAVICPLSDERRRNLPAAAIDRLQTLLRQRYPQLEVLVLVRELADLEALAERPAATATPFHDITGLCALLAQSAVFFGTDTGILHLAAAMGIPVTAFFGPTQPHRVLLPGQPDVTALRPAELGQGHCDVKACTDPVCLMRAVAGLTGPAGLPPERLRPDCPLNGPQPPD
jgi:ADP-heptose:LPS heptosyltransferase